MYVRMRECVCACVTSFYLKALANMFAHLFFVISKEVKLVTGGGAMTGALTLSPKSAPEFLAAVAKGAESRTTKGRWMRTNYSNARLSFHDRNELLSVLRHRCMLNYIAVAFTRP